MDLRILTSCCDWFVVAGDLNCKHPLWNILCTNPTGFTLFYYATINSYTVIEPPTSTHFPSIHHHHPEALDVTLVKLPHHTITSTFLNELSSNHNPIILQISNSPISTTTPKYGFHINWKKYSFLLEQKIKCIPPSITTPASVDQAVSMLTDNIQTALDDSKFILNNNIFHRNHLLAEISHEIEADNRLH